MFLKRLFSWWYRWVLCWVPVGAEEKVLRLITKDWHKPGKPVPFGRVAFEPNRYDDDGISLYRERWVTPLQLDASRRKPGTFFVVRLRVCDIRALGLTVRPTVGDQPGHVVIPELSARAYAGDKRRLDELVVQLATLAGQDIVLRPKP